jgi:beta-glucosidase
VKKFPDGFYFGASTSSHQVEGDCCNDWTEWEKLNSARLAAESVKYGCLQSWERISGEASEPANYISGKAADHYHLYEKDLDLAEKIGLNAYRFSVEWQRIEPERGTWNIRELSHYSKMIDAMLKRGIEPFVTFWHWTLPLWLSRAGGAACSDFPELFAEYAVKLAEKFLGRVKFFIPINEPEIYALNSYLRGIWPPEKKSIIQYFKVMKSLIRAHNMACAEIKRLIPESAVGTACNMSFFEPGPGPVNRFVASVSDRIWNCYFIDRVVPGLDFIGVNYYFHNRINYGFNKNENLKVSDMGWELYPEGMEHVLSGLKKYSLPVFVTENGLADACDADRPWLIEATLRSVMNSMENGADVKGYFHWSLIDNFEWDKGFWPRFGLISVDRKNLSRKIRKDSADVYRRIIKKGFSS